MVWYEQAVYAISVLLLAKHAQARSIIYTPTKQAHQLSTSTQASPPSECVTYHGDYEGTSVYYLQDDDCVSVPSTETWLASLETASIVPSAALSHEGRADLSSANVLLHVQQARTEKSEISSSSRWANEVEDYLEKSYAKLEIGTPISDGKPLNSAQRPLQQHIFNSFDKTATSSNARPTLLITGNNLNSPPNGFYSVPKQLLPFADLLFPPTTVLVSVPVDPLPLSGAMDVKDVPKWLQDSLKNVHYSPLIDAILQDVNSVHVEKDVRHLTGEDGQTEWRTRHSFTEGGKKAGQWIKALMEKESGAKCQFEEHDYGFSPNVICQFKGLEHPEELVILGAHYDSRGTWGYVRAPGGDDDASGVSALLTLARLIKSYNIQFKRTVVLAFFSGEEQGLLGSRRYAKTLKDEGKNVRFMLQADMLGYHEPGEPMQIALPDRYDTIEARWLVGNLSMTYVPDLQVGTTPACCSDHQSFDQQGFVSTWVFERNGPIADPKYHNSEDLSDRPGYDFEQIAAIGKVMLATLLVVSGFSL